MHASLGQHTQHECRIMIVAVRRCSTRSRRRRPRSPLPSRHCHPLSFRHHIISSSFRHHAERPIVTTFQALLVVSCLSALERGGSTGPEPPARGRPGGTGRPRLQRQAGVLASQAGQTVGRRRAGAGQQRVTATLVHRLSKNPARIMGAAPCGTSGVAAASVHRLCKTNLRSSLARRPTAQQRKVTARGKAAHGIGAADGSRSHRWLARRSWRRSPPTEVARSACGRSRFEARIRLVSAGKSRSAQSSRSGGARHR